MMSEQVQQKLYIYVPMVAQRIVEREDELQNFAAFLVKGDKNGNPFCGLTGHPKC